MHSTNYTNAFIEVADDCPADGGKIPPEKQEKTIARMHYELIHDHPYQYTSDEVVFAVYAAKNSIGADEEEGETTMTPVWLYLYLTEHEAHHHGQLINFIYAHNLPIPPGWAEPWALSRKRDNL